MADATPPSQVPSPPIKEQPAMNRKLTTHDFDQVLAELSRTWRLLGPKRFPGHGAFSGSDVTGYGEITNRNDLFLDGKTWFSPKECLFPIRETLFHFHDQTTSDVTFDDRPTIILLRPCDIHGIHRLDTIFLNNGQEPDFYYARRRERIKFFLIECRESYESCFCVSMQTNKTDDYACALRFDQDGVAIHVRDELFATTFATGTAIEPFLEFVSANPTRVTIPNLEGIDLNDVFQHDLWQEYTSRCIACGRCNTSCVTCSCFTMQDVAYDRNATLGERRRVWAGCHVDGFTDMAGGHSFRTRNGDRMRFKTMHKINDFHRRFGVHMCVGCGRCEDVCPEYISFAHCINRLERISRELKHA